MRSRFLLLSFVLVLLAAAAAADEVMIHDAWVREPPPGTNAAAYLTIHNAGDEAVRVVSASSPAAERVELHESVVEGGVARMRPVDALEVPAGGQVKFAPGGLHVMLIAPTGLSEGVQVVLRFELEGGDALEVEAPVRKTAGGAAHEGHGAAQHHDH